MNRIPIRRVTLYLCSTESHMRYATDTLTLPTSLLVRLETDGLAGWGEVFLPRVEPLWSWARQVAPLLLGCDAAEGDALLDRWPADRTKLAHAECGTYCHPDVDCVAEACSIALYDLTARAAGVPMCSLLGTPARHIIPGMAVVMVGTPTEMAEDALGWLSTGLRHLKLKLAGQTAEDCARVAAVRAAVGPEVDLQVDANGSYRYFDDAQPLIDALNAGGVGVIEDLFDVGHPELCRAARAALSGRYMVDKDAHWPHVREVLRLAAADLINQHPHNQGRLSYALRIADAAHAAGVENAIGSSGIFGVQDAAFQHLAAVTGLTRPCEDIGLYPYFDGPVAHRYGFPVRPTVLAEPVPVIDGDIHLPDGLGLGVEVDPELLARFRIAECSYPD